MHETKIKRILLCALFGIVLGMPVFAEDTSTTPQGSTMTWTLEDCLRYAMDHTPRMAQAKENVSAATGRKWSASGQFLPQLSLNSIYSHSSVAPSGSLGSSSRSAIRPYLFSQDVYTHAFSASQTLFSWAMKPTFSSGEAEVRRAQAQYRQTANDLTADVHNAWFTVLFAKQSRLIAQTAEAVARENHETAKQLYKEGKASHFDVSRAKVSWVNARTEIIATQNAERLAIESLRTVVGMPSDQPWAPEGRFPEDVVSVDLDQELRRALSNRPELEDVKHLEKQSAESVEQARAGLLPALGANYTYSWEGANLTANKNDHFRSWSAGAAFSIPIFDGGSSWGRLREAKAGLRSIRATEQSTKDSIVLEVKRAFLGLTDALERLPAQKENMETAQENLRIAQERYALGLLSQLELKDAELSLTQAQTLYAKALFEYNVARAALNRAVGEPY